MIITVVCDVFGEENNGTIVATMNLIRFLQKQGHTVRIVCADQSKKGQENFYVVPTMNFGKLLNGYVKKVGVTLAKVNKTTIEDAIKDCDAVHIMVPLFLGMSAIKIAKKYNKPVTAGFHMQAENFTTHFKVNKIQALNRFVYRYIWNHLYKYVDGIHYPTEFIKNTFIKNLKTQPPKEQAYVISNGVHSYVKKREQPKPDDLKDKIVILSTGRYAREKSQDVLIKAVALSKYKDNIQLILAGLGAKEEEYKKLAKKLGVNTMFNFYSRTEIIDVLNYSDMYVHPAEIELEGIACLEAICCGKLTIVSDSKLSATKGFAIDKRCIFRKGDPKDLAKRIDYWIDRPKLAKMYENKYLHKAIAYDQEECMKKMEQMIFDVVEKKKQENSQNT